jgi:cytochrome c-type protein NapC
VPNNQATVTDHVGPDQALLAYHQPPQCLLQPGLPDLGGFIAGVVFWGAFNTALELTNTEQFCTGCHEMRDNVYQELQGTIHFTNRSGVRAKCSDCHVPHNWTDKMARKMQASKEVWAKIFGTVDTREIPGAPAGTGAARMGPLQGQRFARMPQLPRLPVDGLHAPEPARAGHALDLSGQQGKDLHRLPQGIAHHLPDISKAEEQ